MKKLGAAAAVAAMTIVVAALCGVALADDHAAKPDNPAPPPKAAKPDATTPSKPESASNPQKAPEPESKVYICHATGSASNPYVLIHVSSHALPAHTTHQDGRDIVLGASPGTCPGASTTSQVRAAEHSKASEQNKANESATKVKESEENEANETSEANESENSKVFVCHHTHSATNPWVLIDVSVNSAPAHGHHGDIVLGSTAGPCPPATSSSQANLSAATESNSTSSSNTSATESSSSTSSNMAATSNTSASSAQQSGRVLGATKALTKSASPARAAKRSANAGVLGTLAKLSRAGTSGTLPFSGLRLWIVELVALGLIGLGVATRLLVRRRPN